MIKVYIVTLGYQYEGHDFSKSFKDEESAVNHAMEKLKEGLIEEGKVWSSIVGADSELVWFAERDSGGNITKERGDEI